MKCSLGISNFLEEISNLSHSVVVLYFFALIAEEGFLIYHCYFWNSAFKWEYLSFSPLLFASLLFTAICKASSDNHFAFLHFFSMGMVLLPVSCTMSRTSVHSSSGAVSDLVPQMYFSLPLYNHKGFGLGQMVVPVLVFWRICILFSTVTVSDYIPTNSVRRSPFSIPSPAFIVCRFFDDGHSDCCEVIPHCHFNLHFSNN